MRRSVLLLLLVVGAACSTGGAGASVDAPAVSTVPSATAVKAETPSTTATSAAAITPAPTTAAPTTGAPTTAEPMTAPPTATSALPAPQPAPGRVDSTTLVGDSIAYGARAALESRGVVVNTRIGRTFADGPAVIKGLAASGALGRRVIIHLGTTATVEASTCDEVMDLLSGRRVTIVTVYAPGWSDWQANSAVLRSCAARHGAGLRDWAALAAAHDPAWFFSDHRHLKGSAAVKGYVNLVLS